ncbi:Activator of Hsp90 ATPase homolog 1-like protein [Kaistella treverensis]|uniref:Activator of Hsp90 ATPase homolog 1-like protein n=1 Tax=Kaistella treverensis TaxID=631455 RepID=A0A1I3JHJ9_9FLAO|nr:SRPBCC domain-containing protein [Kaistella treverensis]SFI59590.1 Activator of Hsp90 ATPase homolog 1-like protein [Kaistella treverensis]
METLNYEMYINAPIQDVWNLLWSEETYGQWTQFFEEGSQFKTDWKVGGKTYFTNKNGEGMVSTIVSLNEPTEVVFSHLGTYKNDVEDTQSRDVKQWSGTEEKYFLRAVDDTTTELRAIVHADESMVDMMNTGFNKGFELLKKIAES